MYTIIIHKYNHISTIQLHVCTKRRKHEGHTNQNKVLFSIFKEFHNEHGYISYFNFIFCFHKFHNVGIFNLFQEYGLIYVFLNSWYNGQ